MTFDMKLHSFFDDLLYIDDLKSFLVLFVWRFPADESAILGKVYEFIMRLDNL